MDTLHVERRLKALEERASFLERHVSTLYRVKVECTTEPPSTKEVFKEAGVETRKKT
jgi:uncharacterized coiled-coil protein SlyX